MKFHNLSVFVAISLMSCQPGKSQLKSDSARITFERSLTLSPEVRAKENARWQALGLDLYQKDLLLEDPFSGPIQPRSFIVPTDWFSWEPPNEKISTAALRKDLLILKAIMEDGYGGWDVAAAKGWNWGLFFEQWDEQLSAMESQVDQEVAFAYFEKFKEFQIDNHSGFFLKNKKIYGSYSAVISGNPEACESLELKDGAKFELTKSDLGQQPKSVLTFTKREDGSLFFRNAHYVAFPWTKGKSISILCSGSSYSLKKSWQPIDDLSERNSFVRDLSVTSPDEPTYRLIDQGTGYLRLPTFNARNVELLQKLATNLPNEAGTEKILIIDMRLNEGGDGSGAFNVLKRWLSPEELSHVQEFPKLTLESCASNALNWGYQQFTKANVQPPISDYLRTGLQSSIDAILLNSHSCSRNLRRVDSNWNFSKRNRNSLAGKKILLLVDNMCGSDCEYVAYVLGALPRTVIAGQNTFGVMQFIQPGFGVLPHTGITFMLATGASDIYGDNRSTDGHGLDVDILLVEKEQQSADSIKALAKFLIKN